MATAQRGVASATLLLGGGFIGMLFLELAVEDCLIAADGSVQPICIAPIGADASTRSIWTALIASDAPTPPICTAQIDDTAGVISNKRRGTSKWHHQASSHWSYKKSPQSWLGLFRCRRRTRAPGTLFA